MRPMKRRDFITFVGGATVAWPLAARTQQPAMPVIGFLHSASPETHAPMLTAFRQGLKEAGYVEGHNVAIEYRWAEGHYDRLPALAADLVRRQVAEIVTVGTPAALAAKAASSTIPIVILVGIDPVQIGLVAGLNRPGGNVTGLAALTVEVEAKRLEVLHELLRTSAAVALLVNPNNPLTEPETKGMRDAARSLGLQLHVLDASTEGEIDTAFGKLIELRVGALLVSVDSFLTNQRSNRGAGGPPCGACNLWSARVRHRRRPDELWTRWCRRLSSSRHLRRQDSQGRETGRLTGPTSGKSGVRRQPQDRQDTRPHLPDHVARPRR
jgi:putative ABC transport system substrate-binding protein